MLLRMKTGRISASGTMRVVVRPHNSRHWVRTAWALLTIIGRGIGLVTVVSGDGDEWARAGFKPKKKVVEQFNWSFQLNTLTQ